MLHIKNAFLNVYLFMTNQDKFGILKQVFSFMTECNKNTSKNQPFKTLKHQKYASYCTF